MTQPTVYQYYAPPKLYNVILDFIHIIHRPFALEKEKENNIKKLTLK